MMLAKPNTGDIPCIVQMIDDAREVMRQMGIDQWQGGASHPGRKDIENDIVNGNCYVVRDDDGVVGYAVLDFETDPVYDGFKGKWLATEKKYGTIRRIVTCGRAKRHGVATRMVNAFQMFCAQDGVKSLRLYTHIDNRPMCGLAEKLGFKNVGTVYLSDGAARVMYEKKLPPL